MAQHNTFATFANKKSVFKRLQDIDGVFRMVLENLHNSPDWFIIFFFLRAHAAYLGGVRFTLAGQIPEAYAVLRSCLENSLYGIYLWKNPKSKVTWLNRHKDAASKKKVKNEFKIGTMLDLFDSIDKRNGPIIRNLYEQTIDYGGHPNERAILSTIKKTQEMDSIRFDSTYLDGDTLPFRACLKTSAQIGIASLLVFYNIFRIRFDLVGLPDQINRLKQWL